MGIAGRRHLGTFKNAVKQGQWEQSLKSGATPAGEACFKKAFKQNLHDILPGAPDGDTW